MKSINFDEGYREYKLNEDDSRVIRIRITDANLVSRIEKSMERTNELISKYKNRPNALQLAELDKDIRTILNDAFGSDICTPAFGTASLITPLSDGKLLLFSFFDAFLPVLKADMEAMKLTMKIKQPEVRPEVQKYLEPVTVASMMNPVLPDISRLTPEQREFLKQQL
jgi:hypothetical protein